MRNLGGGLEQDQALVCVKWIDPPTEQIAREDLEIEFRIFAAERQLESGFAVRVPMAGACVAARFGDHRHDFVAEGNGVPCGTRQQKSQTSRARTPESHRPETTHFPIKLTLSRGSNSIEAFCWIDPTGGV